MRCLLNCSFRVLIDLVNLCLNDVHFEHGVDRSDVEEETVAVDMCLTCVDVHVADVGVGREIVANVGVGREIVTDVGVGREIVADVGVGREIVADVGVGREIVADVGAGREIVADVGAEREIVTDVGAGREIVADVGAGREIVADVGAGREIVADVGAGREIVTDVGAEREIVADVDAGCVVVASEDEAPVICRAVSECETPNGRLHINLKLSNCFWSVNCLYFPHNMPLTSLSTMYLVDLNKGFNCVTVTTVLARLPLCRYMYITCPFNNPSLHGSSSKKTKTAVFPLFSEQNVIIAVDHSTKY